MIDLEKLAESHKALFPKATLESQVWKLEEEMQECNEANSKGIISHIKSEYGDVLIVCGGLYRWTPLLARAIALDAYRLASYQDIAPGELEEEVDRKWQINLKRKWGWNGKTYHHVEE